MIDVNTLKSGLNCIEIIRSEIGEPNSHRGYYASWTCPFCGKVSKSSFTAWENGWKCWKGCGQGDVIGFIQALHDLNFSEACEYLAGGGNLPTSTTKPAQKPAIMPDQPPAQEWIEDATQIINRAQTVIWEDAGKRGLDYLRSRGFMDGTIRSFGFGYIPKPKYRFFKGIKLVEGIVIPTYREGKLWNARYRTFSQDPAYRYLNMNGGRLRGSLWGSQFIEPWQVVFLVEGDLNAAMIWQAGYQAVSTSSATNRLSPFWLPLLLTAPNVFVWGDNDQAGQDFNKRHCQLGHSFTPINHELDANDLFLRSPQALQSFLDSVVTATPKDDFEAFGVSLGGVKGDLMPRLVNYG